MQATSLSELTGGTSGGLRRRVAAGLLAVSLTFGGVVVASPAAAQPAVAVAVVEAAPSVAAAGPVHVEPQFRDRFRRNFLCRVLDGLANRFGNFRFFGQINNIINSLRARFGCISPG